MFHLHKYSNTELLTSSFKGLVFGIILIMSKYINSMIYNAERSKTTISKIFSTLHSPLNWLIVLVITFSIIGIIQYSTGKLAFIGAILILILTTIISDFPMEYLKIFQPDDYSPLVFKTFSALSTISLAIIWTSIFFNLQKKIIEFLRSDTSNNNIAKNLQKYGLPVFATIISLIALFK